MAVTSGRRSPRIEVHDHDALSARAAELVAAGLREAVSRRGRASVAFSGGSTPQPMFDALAIADVPWAAVHVLQVDERMAPDGHGDRNLTDLRARLLDRVPIPADHVHPVPAGGGDAEAAAAAYATTLERVAGDPVVLDVVHLGLGDDGHTASLVPDDPAVEVRDRSVAASREYQGRRRVTLTVPVLRAAGTQVWLVAGTDKADAVDRLRAGARDIPATSVLVDDAIVLLDRAAARGA